MDRLQELYKEVHDCHQHFEGKLSPTGLAHAMLTAAQYIEDDHFGDGGTYFNSDMNAFWEEMEGNWAGLDREDSMMVIKCLRWGARQFNGTEAWLEAIKDLDDMEVLLDEDRESCMKIYSK